MTTLPWLRYSMRLDGELDPYLAGLHPTRPLSSARLTSSLVDTLGALFLPQGSCTFRVTGARTKGPRHDTQDGTSVDGPPASVVPHTLPYRNHELLAELQTGSSSSPSSANPSIRSGNRCHDRHLPALLPLAARRRVRRVYPSSTSDVDDQDSRLVRVAPVRCVDPSLLRRVLPVELLLREL